MLGEVPTEILILLLVMVSMVGVFLYEQTTVQKSSKSINNVSEDMSSSLKTGSIKYDTIDNTIKVVKSDKVKNKLISIRNIKVCPARYNRGMVFMENLKVIPCRTKIATIGDSDVHYYVLVSPTKVDIVFFSNKELYSPVSIPINPSLNEYRSYGILDIKSYTNACLGIKGRTKTNMITYRIIYRLTSQGISIYAGFCVPGFEKQCFSGYENIFGW